MCLVQKFRAKPILFYSTLVKGHMNPIIIGAPSTESIKYTTSYLIIATPKTKHANNDFSILRVRGSCWIRLVVDGLCVWLPVAYMKLLESLSLAQEKDQIFF